MKSIEEEIKQKRFPNIYVKTDVNLLFTTGILQNEMSRFFKKQGITLQQFNVLRILRGQHPNAVMLSQISERMIDRMSNATRLVEKLKQKGFVTREVNPASRRQVDIRITEKGLALLQLIDERMHNQIPVWHYAHVTNEELEFLNLILDKIRT